MFIYLPCCMTVEAVVLPPTPTPAPGKCSPSNGFLSLLYACTCPIGFITFIITAKLTNKCYCYASGIKRLVTRIQPLRYGKYVVPNWLYVEYCMVNTNVLLRLHVCIILRYLVSSNLLLIVLNSMYICNVIYLF